MLNEFIVVNREQIINRCRAKATARAIPLPIRLEVAHGVPRLLDQLVDALHRGQAESPAIDQTASRHAHDLRVHGLAVSEVVHGYGDVCQSITELAMGTDAPISADDFRMLHGCLQGAIAKAVTQYTREQGGVEVLERQVVKGSADELASLIRSAIASFEVIHSGSVARQKHRRMVLRNMVTACDLIERSMVNDQQGGQVTLKGPVRSAGERRTVEAKATEVWRAPVALTR